MVDGLNRPKAHRNRGEFPEVGHEPGMRIRRQPTARLELASKILQLLFRNAAFEISTRINAGCRVSLKVHNVAVAGFGRRLKKVIKGNFVERGRRSKRG